MLLALLALVILLARILGQNQQKMEQRERLLDRFVNAAHEMAQPLQVIMMSSGLLQRMAEENRLQSELVAQFTRKITDGAACTSRLLQQFSYDGRIVSPSEPEGIQVADARPKRQ
jgi:light-regulated signal transduction histidine kinase (bacteriophytochrome)